MADDFFGRRWPEVDWKKGLKRKYDIKETEAGAARMRAQTEAISAERRFGPEGLAGEELTRRYPYGAPMVALAAEREKATAYAGGKEQERKESEFWMSEMERRTATKKTPEGRISAIEGMLDEEEGEGAATPLGKVKCPSGHVLRKGRCVPRGFDIY
jgi:hypothetical protein